MIDNCADDWRIAMTWQRMMQIGEPQPRVRAVTHHVSPQHVTVAGLISHVEGRALVALSQP